MNTRHGQICWTELMTRDVAAARAYYEKVLGWAFTSVPDPTGAGQYHIAMLDGQMIAGVMDMSGIEMMQDMPPHWFTYFAVDDLEAAVAQTVAEGGKIVRPIFEVPGTGHIAIVWDAAGAALGLMRPAAMDAAAAASVAAAAAAEDDDIHDPEDYPV